LELPLNAATRARLLALIELLAHWNRRFSLTAVREPLDMVVRHLLDSLVVLPYLRGKNIIDVGSGPGFPGLPIAIAQPEIRVTLLDSNLKRTRFCRHACQQLGLTNVEIVRQRAEAFVTESRFDCLMGRAFGTTADLIDKAGHLLNDGGMVISFLGRAPDDAAASCPSGYRTLGVHAIEVPYLEAPRHLALLERV
jgi:16S rRNA (guanine527-N7)-methyltransferase